MTLGSKDGNQPGRIINKGRKKIDEWIVKRLREGNERDAKEKRRRKKTVRGIRRNREKSK